MTGNDLVDLNQAATDSNWRRKGYLDKIYTLTEQKLIKTAKNPNEMVWLLWSMKEAAYKIYSRKMGIRNYAPTSLVCFEINCKESFVTGKVKVSDQLFYTKSYIQENYIHSLASSSTTSMAKIRIAIYEYPNTLFDYKSTSPQCVSHHGKYLALIY